MTRKPVDRRTACIAAALLVVAFGTGYALAAALAITNGSGENGSGRYHTATNNPAWWSESAVGFQLVPSGVTTLSTTVGTPTVLAASSSSYAINAPTAQDVGHHWNLQETSAATTNTELELRFQVSAGGAYPHLTVYVETQATAPSSTLTFTMWFDLGSGSAVVTTNSIVVIWLVCSAVGTCP